MLEAAALAVIQGKPTGPAYLRTLCEMAGYDVKGEGATDDGTGKVTFTIIANGRDGPLPETPDDDNPMESGLPPRPRLWTPRPWPERGR